MQKMNAFLKESFTRSQSIHSHSRWSCYWDPSSRLVWYLIFGIWTDVFLLRLLRTFLAPSNPKTHTLFISPPLVASSRLLFTPPPSTYLHLLRLLSHLPLLFDKDQVDRYCAFLLNFFARLSSVGLYHLPSLFRSSVEPRLSSRRR